MDQNPAMAAPPMLPRYLRPLSAGSVLDETFRIYRRAWLRLTGLTVLSSATVILIIGLTTIGALALAALTAGRALFGFFFDLSRGVQPAAPPAGAMIGFGIALLLVAIAGAVVSAAGQGGVSYMAEGEMRDQRRSVWLAFRAGLRRSLALVGAMLVYGVGVLAALALAVVPFVVFRTAALLGIVVALVGLLVWWLASDLRGPVLKWVIVLATPFALPFYCAVRWSLWLQAAMLDRAGPVRAIRRSHELVDGNWFRVLFIWVVMFVIVSVLQAIPGAVVGAAFAAAGGAQGLTIEGIGQVFNVANTAGSLLGGALFGSLPLIAATLMYVDLRNRREGADLGERLERLEESAGAPSTL